MQADSVIGRCGQGVCFPAWIRCFPTVVCGGLWLCRRGKGGGSAKFERWHLGLVALSLFAVLALVAAGCGDDDDDQAHTEEATEATEEETAAEEAATEDEPTEAETTPEGTEAEDEAAAGDAEFDEQAVADFYSGQTVTMLVGLSAGGGFDTQARLIAEHLGQYIPGNPTVIVENMPGAGSLVAWNHMANAAPSDGTVIGYSVGSQILQQMLGNPAVEFDAAELQYLGAIVQDQYILPATSASGITSFDQILPPDGEQLVMGGDALGSASVDAPLIIQDVLDANINLVDGYGGLADVALAMESGEVGGFVVGLSSARSAYAEQFENDWTTILTFTEERVEDLPDVPTVLEIAPDDFAEQVITAAIIRPAQFVRPLVFAADVPEDRANALSWALDQLVQDEEFLAAVEETGTELDPLTGEELTALIDDFFEMPEDVRLRLQELLSP
ncbi:MAG: hypothetical protein GEU28_04930 [Dehalococcoidia bacterium]|nr:hypothetical protein [Dehalococcoidia bacterium]